MVCVEGVVWCVVCRRCVVCVESVVWCVGGVWCVWELLCDVCVMMSCMSFLVVL